MILIPRNCGALLRSIAAFTCAVLLTAASSSAHTLVVESSPPSAVSVTATPPDSLGATGGATNFSRSYPTGTVVTLTAPNATGRYRFQKWLKDGVPYESSLTTQVTMDANHTLRAMYVEVAPTFPSDLRIMPLGDSITFGYNGGNAGYRGPLYTLLSPLALNFRYIGTSVERPGTLPTQPINQRYHEGHPSYSIQDVYNNLDGFDNSRFLQLGGVERNPNGGYWLTGGNGTGRVAAFPDIITLMIGTNDLNIFPDVQSRLEALISKITTLRPTTKLLVAKITPVPSLSNDEAYNLIVPSVVANFQAAGKNVHLVDLNTGFPANGLDPDGVHPNDIGFNWMANRWFEGIVAAYSPTTIDRPFRISPVELPGQIEAEDFDRGGRGIAYQDVSPVNEGGQYRATDDVDIEATTDVDEGFQVFHTEAGEWLKYTVSVADAGSFTPRLRISNPTPGGEIFMEVDGLNATNNVAIPSSSGWQTVTLPEIQLTAGEHVIRLVVVSTTPGDTAGAINWLSFTANAKAGPSARAGVDLNVVDLDGNESEPVNLNASATIAGDSPSLSYAWSRGGVVIASGLNPTVNLPVGTQVIQLTVTDGNGLVAYDEVLVTVSAKSLMNGSFEAGLANWTVTGSMLIETAAPYTPTDGVKLATFNGGNQSPNGVISQSFATAVGGTYTVSFDAGVVAFNGNTQTIQVTVNGGSLLSQAITLTGLSGGTNRWVPQSFTFVADSAISTVTFRDQSGSTQGLDMTLDNVRISGPPAFPVNTAPSAAPDSYTTNESTPLVVPSDGLLANDSDPNSNPLVAVVNVPPVHGTLSLNLDGSFTYTPTTGYFGTDSFSYHASDGFLNSNIVTVSLTVIEVIPAPVAFGESYGTTEDISLIVPARGVLSNDADLRSRPLTAVLDLEPVHGDLSLNPDGSFVYTPDPGFFGNDSFTYHARNGYVDSSSVPVILTIDEAIPPPTAVEDSYSTNENIPLVVSGLGVLANDTDPRSRPLTASIEEGPSHGSIGLNANGGFVYIPDDSYFGTDSFTYRANNVRHASNVVTVSIVITEVIPPPVAFADSYSISENGTLNITAGGLLANDMDRRSRPINAWLNSGPSHGNVSLNQDGSFTYTPVAGYYGTDYFTYYCRNGYLDSNIATVSLNINETPPAPTAFADSYQTDEDTPLFVAPKGVLSNDQDPRSRPLTAWIDEGPSQGSIGLDANGGFVYIPSPDYFGTDSFTYFARNGARSSGIVTVNLVIREVIPAPLAEADAYTTNENTPLVVTSNGLLANDQDTRSRPLTAVVDSLPSHGTLALNSNGNFTYTPNGSFYGIDTFTYHARNGFVNSESATVTLTVKEVVPAPIAVTDSYTTSENTTLVVPVTGVLGNDFDTRSRPLTAVLDGSPSHGTVALNANGSFIYTPTAGYYGPDSFSYRAHNGFLNSNPVNVSLNVQEVIPAPLAFPDSYTTQESTALVVAASGLLANDVDPRSRALTAVINTPPSHGLLLPNSNGGFKYTPSSGYYGTDSFTYRASNGFVNSNIATVSITINEVIPPPVALTDSYSTNENAVLTVSAINGLLTNDSDPRSRPLTALVNSLPGHGTLALNANGSFSYTPVGGYFGPDSFTYRARNGFLDSNVVTVNLTVNEVIPPPVAVPDSFTTDESTALVVPAAGVLANDSDPRGRPLTALVNNLPGHGTLVLNANGSFIYTPVSGYFGPDSFTYRARNGFLDSNVVTVSLTVREVIPPPVALPDSYSATEGVPLIVSAAGVLANDSDPRSRPLTAVLNTGPSNGTLVLNANGSFTYTPTTAYFGSDSFTYRARNGFLNSNVVTVSLTINEVIPPPVAVTDSYSTIEGTPLLVPAAGVLTNDSDPRSRPLTAVLDAGPSHGILNLNPNGSFNYTPTTGYFGADSFTYRARNGFLNSGVVTVNLTVNELIPPPVAVPDTYSTNENVALTITTGGVLANDSDPRSRPLTAVLDAGPTRGTLALNPNGTFTYTPASGFFGTDSFTYHARNGQVDSNVVAVSLTVNEVIPPPVAATDSYTTSENTPLTVPAAGVLANDSDPRSRSLTAVLEAGPSHGSLTLNSNGSFSYTPTPGYFGPDSFTYHAHNGFRDSNVAVANLTITEVVPPPVATADSYSTNEGTPLLVSASGVLANDSDPRARPLTAVLDAGPTRGTLSLNANGSFNYTPTAGYFGLDSFTYRARNGVLNSGIVTVTLTVNEVIPPPVAVADSYTTNESTPLTVPAAGVLANDSDPRSRPLTAVLATGPSRGTLNLNANGSFTYTPNAGYFGADSFTYRARNGFLNSPIVTVSLTVSEVIPPPVASADSYSTPFGTVLSVPTAGVLANDTDPRGRTITAILNTGPTNGTLSLNPNGSFNYTPANGYTGTDGFTYRANNGTLNSNVVTVNLTVSPFTFSGLVNGSFESGFTGWTATGSQFVHNAAPYIATDGTKLIGFNGTDQTPNAVLSQSFATLPGETYTLTFDLGVLAFNTNSQTMQVVATGSGSLLTRTISVNGVGGGINRWYAQSFTFVANSLTTTLTFRDQSTSTLNLDMTLDNVRVTGPPTTGTNTAPVASADSYTTSEGTTLVIYSPGVLSNDTDAQAQSLSAFLNTPPTHGTLYLNTSGSFTYIPDANYFGADSFTYHANDGSLDSNIVTVNLTITEVIPAPVAVADSYTTLESTPLVISAPGVLANDSDPRSRSLTAVLGIGPGNGTLSLNANGSFTYTPATGYVGADSFTYRANNGTLNSNFVTVNLTVNEFIPPPVAVADSYSTNENAVLVVPAAGVLTNDSDPKSRPLTAILSTGPTNGTLSLNSNGSFTYTPAVGYFGADSFTYRANNGIFNSNVVSVSLTVNEVIPPPMAVGDSYSTNEGTALVIAAAGVLTNDNDPRYRPLTAVLSSGPAHGALSLNANGGFTYTPTVGYFGTDSFTYRANNGFLNSNIVSVTLTVNELVPPPVAVGDSYSTNEGTALVITAAGVLANDSDPRSRPLTAVLSSGPAHGTLSLNANGGFNYTPTTGYFGPDSFTYRANNGSVNSNPVTVSLTINEVIPPPVAVGDAYSTTESTPLVVAAAGVLGNDSDPRSRPLAAIPGSGPVHGTLSLNANGSFTYTPTAGYSGPDSFTYRANNGTLDSNMVTVNITVYQIVTGQLVNGSFESGFTGWTATGNLFSADSNPPYTATDGVKLVGFNGANTTPNAVLSQTFTTLAGQTYTLTFDAGVVSYNTNSQTIQVGVTGTGSLLSQAITISGLGGGSVRWLPQSFTFTANSSSTTLTFRDQSTSTSGLDLVLDNVRISANANSAPVAVADSYSTNQNTALVIPASGVLANDTDAQGQSLTATLNTGPSNGTLVLNANGSFTYTPATGYSGSDSFTYRARDGFLDSNIATVNLTIVQTNTAPVATADSYSTNQNTALVIPASGVLANDTDAQGQSLTATLSTGPSNGTLVLNANGSFTYTPATGYSGSDSFTYRARDGFLDSNIATVNLTIVQTNTAPVATADSYSTNQNTALVIPASGVLANDTDAQGQSLTATLSTGPSNGTLVLNANGSFTYTPATGYFGSDSFTYRARDGFLDSNIATVNLTIVQTNTAPVATADSYSTNQNTALVVPASGVLANDTDAQGQSLTALLNTGPSNGTLVLNANGSFTYTPATGYSGSDSFTYRARDGFLDSNIATVSLTVNPVVTVGLVNGSFESGFTGWTSTGNQTIQTASIFAPTNGTKLVGFNGANTTPNAVLSQSFATTPGQMCTLAFDAGVFAYNTNSQTLQVTVTGTNSLLAQTVTLFGNGLGTARWTPQSFSFVANSTTTTLTFRDQSATTAAIDLLLDNVRVNAVAAAVTPLASNPAITQSPTGLGSLSLAGSPGNFTIRMTAGLPGYYVLERSEDLRRWDFVTEKQITEPGLIEFQDRGDALVPQQAKPRMFYRVGRKSAATF